MYQTYLIYNLFFLLETASVSNEYAFLCVVEIKNGDLDNLSCYLKLVLAVLVLLSNLYCI
jgi:glutamate 5-kinase